MPLHLEKKSNFAPVPFPLNEHFSLFKIFLNVFFLYVLKKTPKKPTVPPENHISPLLTPKCACRAKDTGKTHRGGSVTARSEKFPLRFSKTWVWVGVMVFLWEVIWNLSLSLSHGSPLRWSQTWVWVWVMVFLWGDLRSEFEFESWFSCEVISDLSLNHGFHVRWSETWVWV